MAVTISWSTTEPTVDEWGEEKTTAYYEVHTSNAYWRARIKFCAGRISGTRDYAVRAVCEGRKGSSDWGAQGANATPRITVEGETQAGSNRSKSGGVTSTSWQTLGTTQYATVTGAASRSQITAADSHSNSVTLDSPIGGPAIFLNISGTIVEADTVYLNVGGEIIEADGVFLNVGGTIVES